MKPSKEWSDAEYKKFADWIQSLLRTNTISVTFTKKDGSERIMKCTLKPDVLPVLAESVDKPARVRNPELISAFDTEINQWRSFNVRTVKNVSFNLGE